MPLHHKEKKNCVLLIFHALTLFIEFSWGASRLSSHGDAQFSFASGESFCFVSYVSPVVPRFAHGSGCEDLVAMTTEYLINKQMITGFHSKTTSLYPCLACAVYRIEESPFQDEQSEGLSVPHSSQQHDPQTKMGSE